MDATYQTLITQSSISAAVLARGTDMALIELPDAQQDGMRLIADGYTLQGFVGLVDDRVEVAAMQPLETYCMFCMGRAAQTFGQLVAAPNKGDSEDWLNKLMALPDERPEKFGLD